MIKISVVTVVFNAEMQIESTIKSVLKQTYENIEYIVIDGASKDGTLNIINHYKYQIDTIVSEPDQGIYDAMNKALKLISGEWVLFLNAGDLFYDEYVVAEVVDYINNIQEHINKPDLLPALIGGEVIFDVYGKRVESKVKPLGEMWICMPACHQSLFIRADVHCKYPYNDNYKICADHDFFIKVISDKNKFSKFEKPISIFSFDGLSAKQRIKMYEEKLLIAKHYNAPVSALINIYYIIYKLKIATLLRKIGLRK